MSKGYGHIKRAAEMCSHFYSSFCFHSIWFYALWSVKMVNSLGQLKRNGNQLASPLAT